MSKELRLTDEQVEKAYEEALSKASYPRSYQDTLNFLRASAPFLQAPIAPITDEEWEAHCLTVRDGSLVEMMHRSELDKLIEERNAPPKVDKRKEIVVDLLHRFIANDKGPEFTADEILAALDEAAK